MSACGIVALQTAVRTDSNSVYARIEAQKPVIIQEMKGLSAMKQLIFNLSFTTTVRENKIRDSNTNDNDKENENDGKVTDEYDCTKTTRTWQRVMNSKYIRFRLVSGRHPIPSKFVLNKVSMLTKAERIDGQCAEKHLPILKVSMEKCRYKIDRYELRLQSFRNNILSPLTLKSARYILINNSYFPIFWTDKCETLLISQLGSIKYEFCEYIINNCDCSGIKLLYLNNISFTIDDYGDTQIDESFSKFALKFSNLKCLRLGLWAGCDSYVSRLWESFKPIIKANKTHVEAMIGQMSIDKHIKLNTAIEKSKLKISQLEADLSDIKLNDLSNTMCNPDLEYLKFNICYLRAFEKMMEHLGDEKPLAALGCTFDKLKVIDITTSINGFKVSRTLCKLDTDDALLRQKMIFEGKLFVITDITVEVRNSSIVHHEEFNVNTYKTDKFYLITTRNANNDTIIIVINTVDIITHELGYISCFIMDCFNICNSSGSAAYFIVIDYNMFNFGLVAPRMNTTNTLKIFKTSQFIIVITDTAKMSMEINTMVLESSIIVIINVYKIRHAAFVIGFFLDAVYFIMDHH